MPEISRQLKATADQRAQKRAEKRLLPPFDWPFLIIVIIMVVFGLVMVFSASHAAAYYYEGDSYLYIRKQFIFALMGFAGMIFISCIDYHILHKISWWLLGVSLVLLVIVLFMPTTTFARRWIYIPGVGQFQPSDIAKLAVIMVFAHIISVNHEKMKRFSYGVLPFLLLLAPVIALMMMEPHVSGTVIILGISGLMMFIGGTGLFWFGLAGGGVIAGVVGVILLFPDKMAHVFERITAWQDPFADALDSGYQIIQGLYAIGSGGLLGLGIGNSRQKHLYVSEAQNDYIFTIICEELGFVGAMLVIFLFVALMLRGIYIATKAKDKFGTMLVVGIVVQITLQAALNIAVVTKTIPSTGISLPFFSYGGTALVMLLFEVGIVLNVSRQASIYKV